MNNKLSKFIAILIFFAGLLVSGAQSANAKPVKTLGAYNRRINLSGTDWQLVKVNGAKIAASKAVIRFDEEKSRVSGNGGCNAFGGTLTENGANITITQVISTKMACQQGADTENKFFRNLAAVTKYKLTGGKLKLYAGSAVVLEFRKKN